MNCNLVGSIYGRSSIQIAHFVPIRSQIGLPLTILVSDWSISKESSPLKSLGQMNRNVVGSIYVRFSIKTAHFVQIHYQAWPPQAILVSDWTITKPISSPLKQHCRMNQNLVESIYKDCSFRPDLLTNMATIGNSCFWLFLKEIFSSKTEQPYEPTFGRKHLWKVLYTVSSKQNER